MLGVLTCFLCFRLWQVGFLFVLETIFSDEAVLVGLLSFRFFFSLLQNGHRFDTVFFVFCTTSVSRIFRIGHGLQMRFFKVCKKTKHACVLVRVDFF